MKQIPVFFSVFLFLSFLTSQMETYAQGWLWGRGNTGGTIDAWPVATDTSGNVFAAGINFSGTGSQGIDAIFGSITVPFPYDGNTSVQCILVKYDANGNCLWAKGTQNGDAWLMNIATDYQGNCYLFGAMNSANLQIGAITLTNSIFPASEYFLAKFDPSGNILWAKNGGNTQQQGLAVGHNISFVMGTGGISTDALGNIYITANFHLPTIQIGSYTLTNADNSGETDDIFVAKYDPNGNVVWAKSSGGNRSDDAYGLTVTPAGNVFIAGVISSSSVKFGASTISDASGGRGNAFIARYNSSGMPEWASSSGGQGEEFAVGIASDAFNNIYLTGGLSDNSIAFNGTTITNPYPGNMVLYLVKFDVQDNVSWYKTIGGPDNSKAWGYSIAMSNCGVIWVSGSFLGSVIIDGHVLGPPPGSADPVFIAGFSAGGVYAGSGALQSGADDQNGIACDAMGNVYVCSYYDNLSTFVVGPDTLADITSSGQNEWLFVAKYKFVYAALPDTFKVNTDTSICPLGGMMLYAPPGYSGYLWINGNTSDNISINNAGHY